MSTVAGVVEDLKAKAQEKTRAIYVRHGAPAERTLGVSNADMKAIAKTIRKQQGLALALYGTGIFDAMYLAGVVADGTQMSAAEVQAWADGAAGMPMIYEFPVPWVAVETAAGRGLARKWIDSGEEHVAAAGWRTLAGEVTVTADGELDLVELEGLLRSIPGRMSAAANRVRSSMNGFVISVGGRVAPLHGAAMAVAQELGTVAVDVGDTACEVPVAAECIAKMLARGGAVKRKTIRC